MEKIINIDGKEIKFKATAGLPIRYRNAFGTEYLGDLQKAGLTAKNLQEIAVKSNKDGTDSLTVEEINNLSNIDISVFYQIAWAMAKTADNTIPPLLDWLDSFDNFPIAVIIGELAELMNANNKTLTKN